VDLQRKEMKASDLTDILGTQCNDIPQFKQKKNGIALLKRKPKV
jgi:hypothetical protein